MAGVTTKFDPAPTLNRLSALEPDTVPPVRGSGYPEPFRSRIGGRIKQRLGDALGLTQFGVNLVTLGPGGQSSMRHWHTLEDEFVYMLEGELVLVTEAGEQVLVAGMCAGYPAGRPDGHHMINRSNATARYLEIGTRRDGDLAFYPDDDLMLIPTEQGTAWAHKTRRPYPPD
jgi:uncharacterized cupin superfamily protein